MQSACNQALRNYRGSRSPAGQPPARTGARHTGARHDAPQPPPPWPPPLPPPLLPPWPPPLLPLWPLLWPPPLRRCHATLLLPYLATYGRAPSWAPGAARARAAWGRAPSWAAWGQAAWSQGLPAQPPERPPPCCGSARLPVRRRHSAISMQSKAISMQSSCSPVGAT